MLILGLARSLAARGGTIDRRALLQRTRRSPIRPRSSRAEEHARKVSAAKAGWLDLAVTGAIAGRVDMTVSYRSDAHVASA
jgi:hypothetical protein